MAAGFNPYVMRCCADEVDKRGISGKIPRMSVLVEAFLWVVGPDLAPESLRDSPQGGFEVAWGFGRLLHEAPVRGASPDFS